MTRPLDGVALQAYFRRLGYQRETQDFLIHIRTSPPSRTPGARRGNMPVWYPSKKMHCIIWRKTHVPKAPNLHTIYSEAVIGLTGTCQEPLSICRSAF